MRNGNGRMAEQPSLGVHSELKGKLRILARSQHRTLASMVRVLLEEAIELEEAIRPQDSPREEYDITLTIKQAALLIKKGYDLQVWEPRYSQIPLL